MHSVHTHLGSEVVVDGHKELLPGDLVEEKECRRPFRLEGLSL